MAVNMSSSLRSSPMHRTKSGAAPVRAAAVRIASTMPPLLTPCSISLINTSQAMSRAAFGAQSQNPRVPANPERVIVSMETMSKPAERAGRTGDTVCSMTQGRDALG
jgi:hypothetical protein